MEMTGPTPHLRGCREGAPWQDGADLEMSDRVDRHASGVARFWARIAHRSFRAALIMSTPKLSLFALVFVAALAGPQAADANAACYVAKDADGSFTDKKLQPIALSDAAVSPGQPQLSSAQFKGVQRCLSKAAQRGSSFRGAFEMGLRTDGEGKVQRVSVLEAEF